MNKFYQIQEEGKPEQPAVYELKNGTMTPFKSEELGIAGGLTKTPDRAEGQPYWSNVQMITPTKFSELTTPVAPIAPITPTPTPTPTPSGDADLTDNELYEQDQRDKSDDLLRIQKEALAGQQDVAEAGIIASTEKSIQETKDAGERASGALRRILGRAGGFTTTAGGMAVVTQHNTIQGEINELNAEKSRLIADVRAAIASKNADLEKEAWERMYKVDQDIKDRQQKQFDNMLALDRAEILETTADFNIISNIPAGSQWTSPTTGKVYTGISNEKIDPFFTGANIISLAKSIPIGETQELIDPNTGQTWTITGLAEPDINTRTYSAINAAGFQTITTIDEEGNIVNQVSAGRVGKPLVGDDNTASLNWSKGESHIIANIKAGATSSEDMAVIYADLVKPDGANISTTDAKVLMAGFGMIQMQGFWIYTPTESSRLLGITEEGEDKGDDESWWKFWE